MNKESIRWSMQAKRRELFAGERRAAALAVSDKLFGSGLLPRGSEINVYRSFGAELDTSHLLERLLAEGYAVSVPVTEGSQMKAVRVTVKTQYRTGAFGISEPIGEPEVSKDRLAVVLLPGLAFSKDGYRVGYGKGYYDRYLADCNAYRIGLCYDFQVLAAVPHEPFDLPVDAIVTDKRILRRGV